jgi:hypothetical protein
MKQINSFFSREIEQKYSFLTFATPDDKKKTLKRPACAVWFNTVIFLEDCSYRSMKFPLKYFKILLSNLTLVRVSVKMKMYTDQ